MNEILKKRIEEAAAESRRASAETLTTFGLQSSIDDVVELTGMELSYDEVSESAFEKGAEYALSHQWISVEEALPEYDETVLVAWYDGDYSFNHRSNNKSVKTDKYGFCNYGILEIIAWMPIPKFEMKEKKQ